MLYIKLLYPDSKTPLRANPSDAGLDLFTYGNYALPAGQRIMIKTGFSMSLPEGYEAQIRSRSGLAAKSGVFVLNSPGTVDSSYRGEICVVLMNTSDRGIWINNGDRIAQMVINKIELWPPVVVEELDSTDRGEGGFGSTGK